MADVILSRVGEEYRNKTGYEPGILMVMQIGLSVFVGISSLSDRLITHSTLVAESLVYPVVCWNSCPSMVCPRQRMLSRRGTSRGGASRRHDGDNVSHCCHCNISHSTGANPLHSSLFMDAGASSSNTLPAFSSAIFNFTSSTNNPWISAHVSILFIENAQEDDASQDEQGQWTNVNSGQVTQAPEADKEQKDKEQASDPESAKQTQNVQRPETREEVTTFPTDAEREAYG